MKHEPTSYNVCRRCMSDSTRSCLTGLVFALKVALLGCMTSISIFTTMVYPIQTTVLIVLLLCLFIGVEFMHSRDMVLCDLTPDEHKQVSTFHKTLEHIKNKKRCGFKLLELCGVIITTFIQGWISFLLGWMTSGFFPLTLDPFDYFIRGFVIFVAVIGLCGFICLLCRFIDECIQSSRRDIQSELMRARV